MPGTYLSADRWIYNRLDYTMNVVDVVSSVLSHDHTQYKFMEYSNFQTEIWDQEPGPGSAYLLQNNYYPAQSIQIMWSYKRYSIY